MNNLDQMSAENKVLINSENTVIDCAHVTIDNFEEGCETLSQPYYLVSLSSSLMHPLLSRFASVLHTLISD